MDDWTDELLARGDDFMMIPRVAFRSLHQQRLAPWRDELFDDFGESLPADEGEDDAQEM